MTTKVRVRIDSPLKRKERAHGPARGILPQSGVSGKRTGGPGERPGALPEGATVRMFALREDVEHSEGHALLWVPCRAPCHPSGPDPGGDRLSYSGDRGGVW